MMGQQKQEALDSKKINEILTNMKKDMGRVKGERDMMENDVVSSMFQNFANLLGQIFQEKELAQAEVKKLKETLTKYETAHPELKIKVEETNPKKK